MKKTYKRILAATLASILVWNTCEWQPRALAGSKVYQIEEVVALPESVLHQEVPYGTKYKDLELPDKLSMRVWTEDTLDGEEKIATSSELRSIDEKASPSEAREASPSDADEEKTDKNWKEVKVRWVLDETFSEKEKYDGKTQGIYVFDAELKSSRYELDTGFLPRIEVTVLPEEAAPEITEFFELEETIQVQNLALGAKESDIILPDTLDVQVENLDEGGADEADAATEDDKAVDGESTEETVGEEENVGDETASQYQLTGITWKLDEKQSDLPEFHGGIFVQEYFDEFDEDGEPIESEEKTWAGYAEANQEYNGRTYVYTPVLPEKLGEHLIGLDGETAEKVELAEKIDLPEIYVLVGEIQPMTLTMDTVQVKYVSRIDGTGDNRNEPIYSTDTVDCTVLTENFKVWLPGWYVVNENVTINEDVTLSGDVHLILENEKTLTINGSISIPGGASLYIYEQESQTAYDSKVGRMNITAKNDYAFKKDGGISSAASIYFYGGKITAEGDLAAFEPSEVRLYNSNEDTRQIMPMACWEDDTAEHEKMEVESWLTNDLSAKSIRIGRCWHNLQSMDSDWNLNPMSDGKHHTRTCLYCGYRYGGDMDSIYEEACDFTTGEEWGKIDETGHYGMCVCGNVSETAEPHTEYTIPTDDGKGHTSRCVYCGYTGTGAVVEAHSYNENGECTVCGFKPVASDNNGNLYEELNDALSTVEDGGWVQLETESESKEIQQNISFERSGISVELRMNGYHLKQQGNPTVMVENGTLTISGEADIIQNGSNEMAASAIALRGGTLIVKNELTAKGAVTSSGARPAIEASGGELDLRGNVKLGGGLVLTGEAELSTPLTQGMFYTTSSETDVHRVDITDSETYKGKSVSALLADGYAFAYCDKNGALTDAEGNLVTEAVLVGGQSIRKDVKIVEHTQHSFKDNGTGVYECACGAICTHSDIASDGYCKQCHAGPYVASVDGTYYAELSAAISHANGGTVKLETNIGNSIHISTGTFTLDLNGKTVNEVTISGTGAPTITDSTSDMSGLLEQLSIEKDSTGAICLRDFRMKAYSNTKDTRNLNDLLPDGYGVYSNAGLGWLSLSVASANFADKGEVIPAVSGILGGKNIVIPKNSQTLPAELSFQVSDKVVSNFKGVQIKWYNVKSSGTRTLLATETQYNAVKEDGSYVRNTEQKVTYETGLMNAAVGDTFNNVIAEVSVFDGAESHPIVTTSLRGYSFTIDHPSIKDAEITVTNGNADTGWFVVSPKTDSAEAAPVQLDFDVKLGDKTLTLGTDYEVLNDSDKGADAGDYTLKIQGKGNYSGIKEFPWGILQHRLGVPQVGNIIKTYDGTSAVTPTLGNFGSSENITGLSQVKMKEGKDYKIVSANFDSPDVGSGKILTIKVELLNPNYIFEDGERTAVFAYWPEFGFDFQINKADVPDFTRDTSFTVVNDHEDIYCVDLPALPELEQPKQYGTVSYELSKIDIQNGYYTGGVEVEDGRLILPIQKNSVDTTGPIGSVEVTVKTTNYNDITLTVNLNAENKRIPVVTAPVANTLTYNGEEQPLVTAGRTTGGTLLYRLDDSDWSEQIPTAKEAGKYTVWFKVQGSAEYTDVAEQSVTVTIAEKSADIVAPDKNTSTGGSSGGRGSSAGSKQSDSVTRDSKKGNVSRERGILTGANNSTANDGCSHWMQDEHGWWLRFADNSYPKAERRGTNDIAYVSWEHINGNWWTFDENGYIKTGWMRDEDYGGWFYLDPEHGMLTGWVLIDGKWYYFHPTSDGMKGLMYAGRRTPDGYYVDENGVWDGRDRQ